MCQRPTEKDGCGQLKIDSEAWVHRFRSRTRTGYFLGTGTPWVRLGTYPVRTRTKKIKKKLGYIFGYAGVHGGYGTHQLGTAQHY